MDNQEETRSRCAAEVARLSRELGWDLGERDLATYVDALLPHVAPDCSDAALAIVVEHYHLDHGVVRALLDDHHPGHTAAWTQWLDMAERIVRQQYPDAPDPAVAEALDLAQDGLAALSQALPRYHYASRFSTWAYSVVMRLAHRKVRDLRAAKRAATRDAVALGGATEATSAARNDLDDIVAARVLTGLIEAILREQPDARLLVIFRLWAIEDLPVAAIARHMNLSVSRVNGLLAQLRALLRAHPQIASWRDDRVSLKPDEPPSSSGGGTP